MAHRRRPLYEDQDARITILANGNSRKAGYVYADCFKPIITNRLPTGRAIRYAGCTMMCPDHGAVDHLDAVWRCAAIIQSIEHQLLQSCQSPAPELAIDTRPLAELLRQITPGSTGASNPENAIEHEAVVRSRTTALPSNRHQERFKECPLSILHQQTRQDNLRKSYLESDFAAFVNPVCQQDLGLSKFTARTPSKRLMLSRQPTLYGSVFTLGYI